MFQPDPTRQSLSPRISGKKALEGGGGRPGAVRTGDQKCPIVSGQKEWGIRERLQGQAAQGQADIPHP